MSTVTRTGPAPWRLMADQYEDNGEPNLAAYHLAGHRRYMHKVSEGVTHIDNKYADRIRRWHELGGYAVFYHFARPDQGPRPRAEGRFFVQLVRPLMRPGDRFVIDAEPWPGGRWEAPKWYLEELWSTIAARVPVNPALYGSTSFLKEDVAVPWLRRRRRHEAAYGPTPSLLPWGTPRWAWQFTDGAAGPEPHSLPGIGECDISLLNPGLAFADRFGLHPGRRVRKKQAC